MAQLLRAQGSPAKAGMDRFGITITRVVLHTIRNHIPSCLYPLTTANTVTYARMLLTIPVVYGTLRGQTYAFWLFVAAALSDILDGWIARCDGPTKLGAFLDSTSDKVTTLPVLVALALNGYLPGWLYMPAIVLVALEALNLCANIVNYKQGRLDPTRPTNGRKRFSTAAGQIKFWAICLGTSSFMVAYIVSPDSGFGLRYFGQFAICVAATFAGLSLRDKIA